MARKNETSAKQHKNEMLRLKQRATANRLRLCGWKLEAIAAEIGVAHQTISRWLSEERETELAKINIAKHIWKSEQAAKLEAVQNEAFTGWYRSLRSALEVRRSSDDRNGESETTTTSRQCGSPSHLAQVIHASAQLAALLGLNEPPVTAQMAALAMEQTGEMEIVEVVVDSTDEAARLRDQHLVAVRSEAIQPIKETPDGPPSDPKPRAKKRKPAVEATPEADQEAAGVRPPPDPHKRVRGRPRGRKN
jgi:transcriptional regulator with XRE-family HTH domain